MYPNYISGDNMKKETLIYFETPDDFMELIDKMDIYDHWKIQSGLLNERGKTIRNHPYVEELRALFDKAGFFRMRVSIAEIVSWFDTMTLVKRLLLSLQKELNQESFRKIHIYCEYMIQMSKKMRIDYVLEYENRVLLLEFRTVSRFEKIRPTWQCKIQELLVYKELVSYYLFGKEIVIYAFISMFEYMGNSLMTKHKEYNDNQVAFLTEYIKRYIIRKK